MDSSYIFGFKTENLNMSFRKFTALAGIVLFGGCATIYTAPNSIATFSSHRVVAILPPTVRIEARRDVDAEALRAETDQSSYAFQQEIYTWMLQRYSQGRLSVETMGVDDTNALIDAMTGPKLTSKICETLGVDAVISSDFSLSRPMGVGGAIAVAVLFGGLGNTNKASATLQIKDCPQGGLLWKYDHEYGGSLGSTPSELIEGLMREASKKLPWYKSPYS